MAFTTAARYKMGMMRTKRTMPSMNEKRYLRRRRRRGGRNRQAARTVVSDAAFELLHLRAVCVALVTFDKLYAGQLHTLNTTPLISFRHSFPLCLLVSCFSGNLFFCLLLMTCNCSDHRPRAPSVRSRKTDCKVGSINALFACPLVHPEVASIIYCRFCSRMRME